VTVAVVALLTRAFAVAISLAVAVPSPVELPEPPLEPPEFPLEPPEPLLDREGDDGDDGAVREEAGAVPVVNVREFCGAIVPICGAVVPIEGNELGFEDGGTCNLLWRCR
jgi:hypothetical protein